MKYGIYYAYWGSEWKDDFVPYVKKVKDLGFDILEVGCHNFINESIENIRKLGEEAAKEGILLTGGYGPDLAHNIASDDPQVIADTFALYQDMFGKMQAAGIHTLGGGLYGYWPVDYSRSFDKEADWKRSVANMKKLADLAAEYDITLNMEVLNRFEGYLINTCEECVRYVKEVNKPNVKVMLDTFHMNIEEDSFRDAILLAGDLLGHVHIGEANRRPPYAGGRIPWQEIGDALNEIGYTGTVVMEPFIKMGGQVGWDIRVWHDLSNGAKPEEMDYLAARSCAYIRRIFDGE